MKGCKEKAIFFCNTWLCQPGHSTFRHLIFTLLEVEEHYHTCFCLKLLSYEITSSTTDSQVSRLCHHLKSHTMVTRISSPAEALPEKVKEKEELSYTRQR